MISTGKTTEKKSIFFCALMAFFCALIPIAFLIIRSGGFATFGYDYLNQVVPFNMAMNGLKLSELGGWTWNMDLGASTIQSFSFYCLGNLYFWLCKLLPEAAIPYTLAWIYLIKYTVAAVLAFVYLRLFIKNPVIATASALMYAFSGFQSTNLLYFVFHDVVALFPLILIGIEKIDERPRLLAFAVFVNALLNYYFFVMEAVFAVIYALFRRYTVKRMLKCLFASALGVGMAAVLFLPNVLYLLGNPRSGTDKNGLTMQIKDYLFILKAYLIPGEAMNSESCIYYEQYGSIACWLPLAGISLSLVYVIKKRDWLSWLLVLLFVISFVPLFSSVFLLFAEDSKRWLFMMTLMAALASGLALEKADGKAIKTGVIVTAVLLAGFYIAVNIIPHEGYRGYGIHAKRLLLFVAISFAGLALTWLFGAQPKKMLALTAVFAMLTTGITAYVYDGFAGNTRQTYLDNYKAGMTLENEDAQCRENISNNELTLPGNAAGIASFSSTLSNSTYELCEAFGYSYLNDTRFRDEVNGLPELLTSPIGWTVDKPLTLEEVKQLDIDDRAAAFKSDGCKFVGNFSRDSSGFFCSSDFKEDTYVFFTVPNDDGWKAYVDGGQTEIINSCGMMAIHLDAGNQDIVFSYRTPGYTAGLCISAACCLIFVIWWVYDSKRNNSNFKRGGGD